ncbi:hypothetical protein OBBRIDRAFT_522836 [Obba rivulosa]|uniref:Uncharacterized protein n=1 Tax=Obba rivulosa TaxID=1052685 RepID=A0A8E2B4J1_9APHY|nr:hypothetical protein OBBRIDRAFT_522836 [Obba rivulosa]
MISATLLCNAQAAIGALRHRPHFAMTALMVPGSQRYSSIHGEGRPSAPREFTVVLDNGTLYVDKEVAEALGRTPDQGKMACG